MARHWTSMHVVLRWISRSDINIEGGNMMILFLQGRFIYLSIEYLWLSWKMHSSFHNIGRDFSKTCIMMKNIYKYLDEKCPSLRASSILGILVAVIFFYAHSLIILELQILWCIIMLFLLLFLFKSFSPLPLLKFIYILL